MSEISVFYIDMHVGTAWDHGMPLATTDSAEADSAVDTARRPHHDNDCAYASRLRSLDTHAHYNLERPTKRAQPI